MAQLKYVVLTLKNIFQNIKKKHHTKSQKHKINNTYRKIASIMKQKQIIEGYFLE